MTPQQLERLGPSTLRQLARQIGLRGAGLWDAETLRLGLRAYFERASQALCDDADDDVDDDDAADEQWDDAEDGIGAAATGEAAARTEAAGSAADEADGSGDPGLPAIWRTETMARVLEAQGRRAQADLLRTGLRSGLPAHPTRLGSTPRVSLEVHADRLLLGWQLPTATLSEAKRARDVGDDPDRDAGALPDRDAGDGPDPSAEARSDRDAEAEAGQEIAAGSDDGTAAQTASTSACEIEVRLWRANGARLTRRLPVDSETAEHSLDRPPGLAFAVAALGRRVQGRFVPLTRTPLWRADTEASEGARSEARADTEASEGADSEVRDDSDADVDPESSAAPKDGSTSREDHGAP
jgi:hypothetical protein